MTPSLRDKIIAVCDHKIAEKGPQVGVSLVAGLTCVRSSAQVCG
jgi:hypothetical protein